MGAPPIPANEEARLRALRAFEILDSAPEEVFDDLTLLASAVCGTPIATVTFIDSDRQWFKSARGLDGTGDPRDVSFCAHTLGDGKQLVVPNAEEDDRFKANPLVTGDPNIRFYAGSPLVTDQGYVLGTICVIDRVPRDLEPAQLAALEALARQTMRALEYRQQANRLQELGDLVDLAHEAIIVRDGEGRIRIWNDGAVDMYGYVADDIRGRTTHELLATEFPAPLEEINRKLEADGIWQGVLRHRTSSGETVVVESRWALRNVDGEHPVVLEINSDITERSRLEEEQARVHEAERRAADALAEQNEALRELDRAKDEFVALVSHELRTPLASIRGYTEMLLAEEPGPLTDDQRQFLDVVVRNSLRLNGIVDDLLVLATAQAGRLKLSRAPFELDDVLAEVVESMSPAASQKRIELGTEPGGSFSLDADRARICQVLLNLVSNALKFTPAGGRVTLRSSLDDGFVLVDVSDTGMGIPEHELPQLFSQFYRTSAASEQGIAGSGLGLAISRAITEAHDGTLEVAETSPEGTTFRLRLPVAS